MSELVVNPVSLELNAATIMMCRKVWPAGYDKALHGAPESFKALKEEYAARGRITVYSGASSKTIFDDPDVNVDFRAWHDYCHLMGNTGFSVEGERKAAEMQCEHVKRFYGDGRTGQWLCTLIMAEVVGQAEHYAKYKAYVEDQRAFTMAYISHPGSTLSHNWGARA
jgi:hypothetical protein